MRQNTGAVRKNSMILLTWVILFVCGILAFLWFRRRYAKEIINILQIQQINKKDRRRFFKNIRSGDFIALFGELGSGKTTVQGLASGLGIKKDNSPTFIILRQYRFHRGVHPLQGFAGRAGHLNWQRIYTTSIYTEVILMGKVLPNWDLRKLLKTRRI